MSTFVDVDASDFRISGETDRASTLEAAVGVGAQTALSTGASELTFVDIGALCGKKSRLNLNLQSWSICYSRLLMFQVLFVNGDKFLSTFFIFMTNNINLGDPILVGKKDKQYLFDFYVTVFWSSFTGYSTGS